MDEFDNEIRKIFKKDINLTDEFNSFVRKTVANLPDKKLKIPVFRTFATGFACLVFSTGIVFAKDISQRIYNFYETGKGVETAINEGYIAENESEYANSSKEETYSNEDTGIVIEDTETKVKVQDIVMDDFNLSATIVVDLSDKILEQIPAKDIWEMNFPDLIVSDEEGNVLFGMDQDAVKNFFGGEINEEKVCNSGLNSFIKDRGTSPVKAVYNMYVEYSNHYPKSKKLNFKFTEIAISNSDETVYGDEEITVKGNWEVSVDLPEKFYNRESIIYHQVDEGSSKHKVKSFAIYNTGAVAELSLKSRILKDRTKEITEIIRKGNPSPTVEIYMLNKIYNLEKSKDYKLSEERRKLYDKEVYITNSNGEKFELTMGPIPNGGGSIDENGIYNTSCAFDLTAKDATDELTLHIKYLGEETEIKLEKDSVQ